MNLPHLPQLDLSVFKHPLAESFHCYRKIKEVAR